MLSDESSDDDLIFLTPEILEEITPDSPLGNSGENETDIQLGDVTPDDLISSIQTSLQNTSSPAGHSGGLECTDLCSDQSSGASFVHKRPSTIRDRTFQGISGAEFLVIPASSTSRATKRHFAFDEPDALKHIYTETIKEEIRCKIQLKRIKEGQEELTVDYTPPQPTISYEAVKRRNDVREKNKMYAKQSRERIREEREKLENENAKLKVQKAALKEEIDKMEKILVKMKSYMEEHKESCPEKGKLSNISRSVSSSHLP